MVSFLFAGLLCAQQPEKQEGRTESQTGLFVVHGANFRLRAAVTQDGEALATSLEQLTAEIKGDPSPIVVELLPQVSQKPSRIRPEFFVIPESQGGGFRLQVNVRLGKGNVYIRKDLNRVLLEMLVIERALRGREDFGEGDKVEVQPWLLDGLEEALLWQEDKGDRRVYISLAKGGGWMEVAQLVEVTSVGEMDALGRELFRASAGALVMALLDQNEGKKAMMNYLADAATHQGEPLALIRRYFPEVNLGRKGLEKWWSLAVAKMAEKPLTESMTIPETETRLSKILRLHLKDEKGRPVPRQLVAWEEMGLLPLEERMKVVRPTVDLLTSLSYRCFPTYREVIAGYLKVLSDMAGGTPDEIEESLVNLKNFRQGELLRYEKITDLLDWYHLNTVKAESGEFEDYLKITQKLRENRTSKDDPVTKYVDKIQEIYQRTNKP